MRRFWIWAFRFWIEEGAAGGAPRSGQYPGVRARRGGVTLIEMIMAIAILAFLGAIAAPRIVNMRRHQRLDQASRRLMADIRLARSQAIRDNADRKVMFVISGQYYALPNYGGTSNTYSVNLNTNPYDGVKLLSTTYSPSEVAFNRLGIPSAGGTVTLGNGVENAVITISATTGRPTRSFGLGS